MMKKFSLLLTAAAVLAFAVPALASAATGLQENGSSVPVGSLVTGTGLGTSTLDSTKFGRVACNNSVAEQKLKVEGEVAVNSSAEVDAKQGKGAKFTSVCKTVGEEPTNVTVENIGLTTLRTTGGGTGTGTFEFDLTFKSGLKCHGSATNATGTYNPNELGSGKGGHIIKITNQPVTLTEAGQCGKGTLNAEFTIETTNGTPVYIL